MAFPCLGLAYLGIFETNFAGSLSGLSIFETSLRPAIAVFIQNNRPQIHSGGDESGSIEASNDADAESHVLSTQCYRKSNEHARAPIECLVYHHDPKVLCPIAQGYLTLSDDVSRRWV